MGEYKEENFILDAYSNQCENFLTQTQIIIRAFAIIHVVNEINAVSLCVRTSYRIEKKEAISKKIIDNATIEIYLLFESCVQLIDKRSQCY